MQMSSRSNYHHGDLKQAIIDAACEILRSHSADSLSLRAIARDLGVLQTAPYRHFDCKTSLFAAVAIYGFELLTEELQKTNDAHPGTREGLLEVGLTYIDWALRHPEKYQMFHDSNLVDFDDFPELLSRAGGCFEILLKLIRQGMAEGIIVGNTAEQHAAILWAGIHGVASLVQGTRSKVLNTEIPASAARQFLVNDRRASLEMILKSVLP